MASVYEKTRKTYNSLGSAYTRAVESFVPKERQTFVRKLKKHSTILDVGCAGGRDAEFFVQRGLQLTGIDTSKIFIQLAKQRVPKATFRIMDARKITFAPKTFEAVWANAVLLHLQRKDIPNVLRRFHRVLVPGGFLHIRVKLGNGSGWVTDKLANQPRFFTYFTKKEMEGLLRKVGFRIQSSRSIADESKRRGVRWLSIEAAKV